MSVDPVGYLPPAQALAAIEGPQVAAPVQGLGAFGQWFEQQLGQVNTQLQGADRGLQSLATGQAQNLHQVMIDLEEARLSFQMLVQVRNRVLEAYQDVMRMQV
jgi:flagellar hook-basal body complex protein FliE